MKLHRTVCTLICTESLIKKAHSELQLSPHPQVNPEEIIMESEDTQSGAFVSTESGKE